MFAHTGEFPRFADASPRSEQSKWRWLALVLVSPMLAAILISAPGERTVTSDARVAAAPGTVLSFARRLSHDKRYVAEVVETSRAPAVGVPHSWDVEIRRRNHRRVAHATITARAWMPEAGETIPTQLHATYIGDSRYRLSDLVLNRPGWWNVDLAVDGIAGKDSVAFNVVLPPR